MTVLSETYAFQLLIDDVDHIGYLLRNSLTIAQGENSEVGSLTAQLIDHDGTLSFALADMWEEVYFKTTTDVYVFGGYLVSAIPEHAKNPARAVWTIKCESWATMLAKVPTVHETYVNQSAKSIVQDLFTQSGLTSFDTTTYVSTGDTISTFVAAGEALPDLLNKLAAIANLSGGTPFAWWVTPAKKLRFGLASGFTAPFGIAPLATANWTTTFPPLRGTTVGQEYAQLDTSDGGSDRDGSGRGGRIKYY